MKELPPRKDFVRKISVGYKGHLLVNRTQKILRIGFRYTSIISKVVLMCVRPPEYPASPTSQAITPFSCFKPGFLTLVPQINPGTLRSPHHTVNEPSLTHLRLGVCRSQVTKERRWVGAGRGHHIHHSHRCASRTVWGHAQESPEPCSGSSSCFLGYQGRPLEEVTLKLKSRQWRTRPRKCRTTHTKTARMFRKHKEEPCG